MSEDNFNIVIPNDYNGSPISIDFNWRTGQSTKHDESSDFHIKGELDTVSRYLENNVGNEKILPTNHDTYVVIKRTGTIQLCIDSTIKGKLSTVTGEISHDTDFQRLSLNTQETRTPRQLADVLKFYRRFMSHDEYLELIASLNRFKVKVDKEIEQGNDFRGNKISFFQQQVKQEMKLDFVLTIPIFQGVPASKFKVEINFDVRDNNIDMWLESVEAYDLEQTILSDLIEIEDRKITELGYTIIYA